MQIIIDTREQLPLCFEGHEVVRKKLDEGDYNEITLIPYIVIERKTLQDFYGSIIQGHRRFKDEIVRSRLQSKTFYVFLEGTLKEFYSLKWSARRLRMRIAVLIKIVTSMQEKYQLIVVECSSREEMATRIIQTIETNKKLYEV
jgi:ERCC4-type nuclease